MELYYIVLSLPLCIVLFFHNMLYIHVLLLLLLNNPSFIHLPSWVLPADSSCRLFIPHSPDPLLQSHYVLLFFYRTLLFSVLNTPSHITTLVTGHPCHGLSSHTPFLSIAGFDLDMSACPDNGNC